MRILVVDTNRWYARKVKDTIEKLAPSVFVDMACNIYEAQQRLENPEEYQLILADIRLAARHEEMAKVLDKSPALKIMWSAVESIAERGNPCRIQKPSSLLAMKNVLERQILPAAHSPAQV